MSVAVAPIIHEGAVPGVHAAVRDTLRRLPRGRLLDAPAGHGAMSAWAHDAGFAVTPVDLDPSVFEPRDRMACIPADLDERLPFADDTFDVVTCVEGIEHVTRQWDLVAELGRVIRPGGTLVITTPNVGSIQSRLKYLATGVPAYFDWRYALQEWGHIAPTSLPELNLMLWKAGFTNVRVTGNRERPRGRLVAALAPLIRALDGRIDAPWARHLLTSDAALFADILIVTATVKRH